MHALDFDDLEFNIVKCFPRFWYIITVIHGMFWSSTLWRSGHSAKRSLFSYWFLPPGRRWAPEKCIKVLIVKHAKAKCKCLTSIWKTKWRWQHNKAHHDICNVNGDDNNDKHDNHHDTAASSASPHRRLSGHDRVLKQPVVNTQHNLFTSFHKIYVTI